MCCENKLCVLQDNLEDAMYFTSVFVCQATTNHLRGHVTPQEAGLYEPLRMHAAVSIVHTQIPKVMITGHDSLLDAHMFAAAVC